MKKLMGGIRGQSPRATKDANKPTTRGAMATAPVSEEHKEEIPKGTELNRMYKDMLDDLPISDEKRAEMLKGETDERKWEMIKAHARGGDGNKEKKNPEYWVRLLSMRNRANEPILTTKDAQQLYAVLRTGTKKFLSEFIELDGIETLIDLTRWYNGRSVKQGVEKEVLPHIMLCYKTLMNNDVGMEGFLSIPDSIQSLAYGIDLSDETNLTTTQEIVMLLAVTCFYSPQGRRMVIEAMEHMRKRWREKMPFQSIVEAFQHYEDTEFRAAAIMFITTLVNSASELEQRVALRNDFLALDIVHAIEGVLEEISDRESESYSIIATQFEVFEDILYDDHKEVTHALISGRSSMDVTLNLADQQQLFEYIYKSAQSGGCTDVLLQLSQALLLIPAERALALPTWSGITEFVRNATDFSHRAKGKLPRLDYQILGELLDRRNELDERIAQVSSGDDIIGNQRKKINELQSELEAYESESSKRSKRGGDCEEVAILQDQIKQLRDEISKLQKELAKSHKGRPVEDDVDESAGRQSAGIPSTFEGKLDSTGLRPAGLVPGVKSTGVPACPLPNMKGSLELAPIPAKSGAPSKMPANSSTNAKGRPMGGLPPPPGGLPKPPGTGGDSGGGGGNPLAAMLKARAAAAPPSPATQGAGAAPGKSAAQVKSEKEEEIRKKLGLPAKKKIQPSTKMRNIFWTPVPVEKLDGTVWPELSDQKVKINVSDLEAKFGLKPTVKGALNPANEKRKSMGKVHLVEGKRQQNVGIALSKIRATDADIINAIWSMDETMLDVNHTQLLLTSVPTDDELQLIKNYEEGGGSVKLLAREDQFLRAMGRIPRLQQRLKAILTRHNFEFDFERVDTKARLVLKATAEVDRSTSLKKLLEIILALGNYVNGGTPRGAAWGFKLDALQQLATVKDNTGKSTLMDYLYALLEREYPKLVDFSLPAVHGASEISLSETMGELNALATAVRNIKTELGNEPTNKKDRFHKVMSGFEVKATKRVTELQTMFEKARTQFQQLATQYAETGPGIEPESFFRKFVNFEVSLQRAKKAVAEKRERQERAQRIAEEKHRMLTLKKLKDLEAAGADEGVFAAFAKANAGCAEDIVQGFLDKYKKDGDPKTPPKKSSPKAVKTKKVKKKVKVIKTIGPNGEVVVKKVRVKKKKAKADADDVL